LQKPDLKSLAPLQTFKSLVLLSLVSCVVALPAAHGQQIEVRLTDANGEAVVDAVIELLSDTAAAPIASTTNVMREAKIDQRDKEFVPTVTTLVAGGSANFPNSDDILHHVYSFSPAKTFDTPLYGSEENNQYREMFDVPGVVEIGCNIHDWMLAYIYVGRSEMMAISDEQGLASLRDIPSGEYTLQIWHARLDAPLNSLQQTLSIEAGATEQLEVTLELARDRRVRRAPSANRKRYR
jgi:plastocyanin